MQVSVKSDFDQLAGHLVHNSPKAIGRAKQASVNKTATTLRVAARRKIQDEIKPRRGAAGNIGRRITVYKARGGVAEASIDFSEAGLGVEHTAKATIRKIRGKGGRYRVSFRGKTLVKAFRLPRGKTATFVRSSGRIKRLFSYTMVQEAEKLDVFNQMVVDAPKIFIPEFIRLVDIFDGYTPRKPK